MRHLQVYRFIAEVARRGSIRKAADQLHITPSALTRKIQDFEEELGTPVFERLPQGMRPNAAGELLLRHILDQNADFERLQAQLSELAGVRRGHVTVACSQAFIDSVLPDEIAAYRATYPQVTFSLDVRDNVLGVGALSNYEADLALLIDPPLSPDVQELFVKHEPLCAVTSKAHPLAQSGSGPVRLRDCLRYPAAMPRESLAIRTVLDEAIWRLKLQAMIAVESDSLEFLRSFVVRENTVAFLPQSGVPITDARICGRPISNHDIDPLRVVLGQLQGRILPVAAEKFAEQLAERLPDVH